MSKLVGHHVCKPSGEKLFHVEILTSMHFPPDGTARTVCVLSKHLCRSLLSGLFFVEGLKRGEPVTVLLFITLGGGAQMP